MPLTQTNCVLQFSIGNPITAPPILTSDPTPALIIKPWFNYRDSYNWDYSMTEHGLIYRFLMDPGFFEPGDFINNRPFAHSFWFQIVSDPGPSGGTKPVFIVEGFCPAYLTTTAYDYFWVFARYLAHQASWIP